MYLLINDKKYNIESIKPQKGLNHVSSLKNNRENLIKNESKIINSINKHNSIQNVIKWEDKNKNSYNKLENYEDHRLNQFIFNDEVNKSRYLSKISKSKLSNEEIRSKAMDMILRLSND